MKTNHTTRLGPDPYFIHVCGTALVEHLLRLFRSTHLFSQEHQELARDFRRKSSLPSKVISHLLAFEDYERARDKAAQVSATLRRWMEEARGEGQRLASEVREEQNALSGLARTSQDLGDSAMPADALRSLRRRLQEVGVSVGREEADLLFVRECRAAIEARHGEVGARAQGLTTLLDEVRNLAPAKHRVAELAARFEQLQAERRSAEEALTAAEKIQAEAQVHADQAQARQTAARERTALLNWAVGTRPRYADLGRQEATSAIELEEKSAALRELRELETAAAEDLRRDEKAAAEAEVLLRTKQKTVAQLGRMVESVHAWRTDRERLVVLKEEQDECEATLSTCRSQEQEVLSNSSQNQARRQQLEHDLAETERDQSELALLLARLEPYLRGSNCPLCGHQHESVEALRLRVRAGRSKDKTPDARIRLERLQEIEQQLTRRLVVLRQEMRERYEHLQHLGRDHAEAQERARTFEDNAVAFALPTDEPPPLTQEAARRLVRAKADAGAAERSSLTAREHSKAARASLEAIQGRLEMVQQAVNMTEERLERVRSDTARLSVDPRAAQVSLDAEPEELGEFAERHANDCEGIDSAVSTALELLRKSNETVETRRPRTVSLANTVETISMELSAQKRSVLDTQGRLAKFGFAEDVDEAAVLAVLKEETKLHSQLAELRDFADSVEVSIDTATTAAAVRQQVQRVRHRQRELEEAGERTSKFKSWLCRFEDLAESVSATQQAEISKFMKMYGPTASMVQQRLRPVYGFHGLSTRSQKSSIQVRAKRGDETLRPTDYFSQSQQQTLLLGLFLTARISQTWSSLATVLLDDPITHFDDLNTYSFLDMLSGLMTGEAGPQQFILSTADRNVFHLARSKFRHLGKDARFYEFAAIGPSGPIVAEVPPT